MRAAQRTIDFVRTAVFAPSRFFVDPSLGSSPLETVHRSLLLGGAFLFGLVVLSLPGAFALSGGHLWAPSTWATVEWTEFPRALFSRFQFVLMLAILSIGVYHSILLVSGRSNGLLHSFVVLVYGPGIYLGVAYAIFFQGMIGIGVSVTETGVPRIFFNLESLAGTRDLLFNILYLVTSTYFVYSLYLGAKHTHNAGRIVATTASVSAAYAALWLFSRVVFLNEYPF